MRLRLTPNSSRDIIDGVVQLPNGNWALKVHVRAVPEKGKANKAAVRLVAKAMGLAPSRISLATGAKDRNKELLIEDVGDQIGHAKEWLSTII